MDLIRNKLVEMGFRATKTRPDVSWSDLLYEWKTDEYRYGSHRISILSESNWYFDIKRSFSGYETGIEGCPEYTCFHGNITSLEDLETIFRCTGVSHVLKENGPNVLKKE